MRRSTPLLSFALCFICSLSLIGCNAIFDSDKSSDTLTPLDEPFQLNEGEHAVLADGTLIEFTELDFDGRCPLDALCIWEGALKARFSVKKNAEEVPLVFEGYIGAEGEGKLEQGLNNGKIVTLERLDPYPGAPTKDESPPIATLRIGFIDQ